MRYVQGINVGDVSAFSQGPTRARQRLPKPQIPLVIFPYVCGPVVFVDGLVDDSGGRATAFGGDAGSRCWVAMGALVFLGFERQAPSLCRVLTSSQ